MKKIIFFSFSLLNAYNLNYALHQTHAFAFLAKKALFILEYQKLNDTVDIFHLKKQELKGNLANYASIGDMNGIKFNFTYGINSKITSNFSFDKQNIEYGSGTLKNHRLHME